MGATVTAASIAIGVVGASALAGYVVGKVIYGIYCGIKYILRKIGEALNIVSEGKGNELANAADKMQKDFKDNNVNIAPDVQNNLQKEINRIRDDNQNNYKLTFNIERTNKEIIHNSNETEYLEEINNSFNKSFIYKEKIINLNFLNERFGDEYLKKFCQIKWENIKELKLNNNNIVDIKPLFEVPLFQLETLDLSNNLIEEIDDLKNLQIYILININFENNKFDDPYIFYDDKFLNLEYLNIKNNNIDDIDIDKFKKKYKKKNTKPNLKLII